MTSVIKASALIKALEANEFSVSINESGPQIKELKVFRGSLEIALVHTQAGNITSRGFYMTGAWTHDKKTLNSIWKNLEKASETERKIGKSPELAAPYEDPETKEFLDQLAKDIDECPSFNNDTPAPLKKGLGDYFDSPERIWQRHNPLNDEYECDEEEYPTQREKIKALNKELKPLGYYARNNGTSTESIGIRRRDGGWQGGSQPVATLFKNKPMSWLSEATDLDKQLLTTIITGENNMGLPSNAEEARQGTQTQKQENKAPLRIKPVTFLGNRDVHQMDEDELFTAIAELNVEKSAIQDAMKGIKSKKVAAKIEEIENTINTLVEIVDGLE